MEQAFKVRNKGQACVSEEVSMVWIVQLRFHVSGATVVGERRGASVFGLNHAGLPQSLEGPQPPLQDAGKSPDLHLECTSCFHVKTGSIIQVQIGAFPQH